MPHDTGLFSGMHNLARLSKAQTRSISPENFDGAKGRGGMATEGAGVKASRELGRGWKVSPCVKIEPGQTFALADIASVAYWYQALPTAAFPKLPDKDGLEII